MSHKNAANPLVLDLAVGALIHGELYKSVSGPYGLTDSPCLTSLRRDGKPVKFRKSGDWLVTLTPVRAHRAMKHGEMSQKRLYLCAGCVDYRKTTSEDDCSRGCDCSRATTSRGG